MDGGSPGYLGYSLFENHGDVSSRVPIGQTSIAVATIYTEIVKTTPKQHANTPQIDIASAAITKPRYDSGLRKNRSQLNCIALKGVRPKRTIAGTVRNNGKVISPVITIVAYAS